MKISKAYTSWENYHKYGIIPNLWAGFTGQKSSEMQTEANIDQSQKQFEDIQTENKRQFDAELDWQQNQFKSQMDFANAQLNENKRVADLNYDLSKNNYDLQKSAFDYQKELNTTQMEREDTAIQRQIADYSAAGFSPLAAIGGNGAPSVGLSSGQVPSSAPQYDMSGINAASGQYADFARQYASLHQTASQNYMHEYNAASRQHNSDVLGARMALSQMKSDMHYKGLNMATQYFNAAVNARSANENLKYIKEQRSYLHDKHEWEAKPENGYRNNTLANAIIGVVSEIKNSEAVKNLAEAIGISSEALNNFAKAFKEKHDEPIGVSLINDDSLSYTEKNTLEKVSQEVFSKSVEELQPWELINLADAATKKEDKLGYKIVNWFKSKFGKN